MHQFFQAAASIANSQSVVPQNFQLWVNRLPNVEKSLWGGDIQRVHASLPKLIPHLNIQIPFVHLQKLNFKNNFLKVLFWLIPI
jgi:hypothetical protein